MLLLPPVVSASHKAGVSAASSTDALNDCALGSSSAFKTSSSEATAYPFCGLANDPKGMHINVDNLIPMINLSVFFIDFVQLG